MKCNRHVLMAFTLFLILFVCISSAYAYGETQESGESNSGEIDVVENIPVSSPDGGDGTYLDLTNEIGSGGNINLNKSYYTYTGGNTIEITTSGVIDGNGAVIDMKNSEIQVFNVNAENVIFNNITFMNINFTGAGGGIYFNAGHGSVTNCNFRDNVACNGSSIFFNDDFGSVINCSFVNNSATNMGGVINAVGDSLYVLKL